MAETIKSEIKKAEKKVEEYWHSLGPGLTTGAADDDSSGIATYSQAGAAYGFNFLWTAVLSFPFMAIVQEMCARIGLVTGRGLAGVIRQHYPRWVLYLCTSLLFVANTFNIGADLGIMAKATQLLIPGLGSAFLVIFFTLFSLGLQIYTPYKNYAKYLKWLALILFSYVLTAFVVDMNWFEVAKRTVWPSFHFSKSEIFLLTAVLGTTISPYLFFWQTSQEVEEQILEGRTTLKLRETITTPKEMKKMRLDVWSGMFLSNMVAFFIIAVCGATLFKAGIHNINSASDAALALKPLAGNLAYLLFTIGILGVGLLGVPVLAGGPAYAISEIFKWKEGLYLKFKQAHSFYGVIIVSMLVGLLLNFLNIDPIKALIYAAALNGVIAPFILVLIVLLSSNKKIMGEWVNKKGITIAGWVVTVAMALIGVLTIWFFITGAV